MCLAFTVLKICFLVYLNAKDVYEGPVHLSASKAEVFVSGAQEIRVGHGRIRYSSRNLKQNARGHRFVIPTTVEAEAGEPQDQDYSGFYVLAKTLNQKQTSKTQTGTEGERRQAERPASLLGVL